MEDVVLAVSTCPKCEAKFCICIVSVPPILLIDFRTTEFSPQPFHTDQTHHIHRLTTSRTSPTTLTDRPNLK